MEQEENGKQNFGKKLAGLVAAFLGTLGIQAAAYLLCEAGIWLTNWLSGMSTVAIVVLVLLGGGIYTSLFLYTMALLPALTVHLSNNISKSRRGVRYWVLGIYTIAGCGLLIYAGIVGAVSGVPMAWHYIRFVSIILASAYMILLGTAEAEPKDAYTKNSGKTVPLWVLWACVGMFAAAAVLMVGVYIPGVRKQAAESRLVTERNEGYNEGYSEGKKFQRNWDTDKMTVNGQNLKDIVNDVAEEYGIEPAVAYDILNAYNNNADHGGYSWDEYQEAIQVIIYTVSLIPYR